MHHHSHHDHSHHGHQHAHHHRAPHQVLLIAVIIIFSFAVVEAIGGWWAGSLALFSDAGHMASDALSLMIAAFAAWIARKPPSYKHSYGLGRAEIVAAWFSSLLMLLISIAVVVTAIERMHHPQHVQGGVVAVIAFCGMVINLLVAWLLAREQSTLNVRAALLHVMSDMLGSMAALVAGVVIYYTGWLLIDPILSVLISILIILSTVGLLRESLLVLMEGVPMHINMREVSAKMATVVGVKAIHDLHIWTLSSGMVALSAHVDIHDLANWNEVLHALMDILKNQYGIAHVTLQPEPDVSNCQPCAEP